MGTRLHLLTGCIQTCTDRRPGNQASYHSAGRCWKLLSEHHLLHYHGQVCCNESLAAISQITPKLLSSDQRSSLELGTGALQQKFLYLCEIGRGNITFVGELDNALSCSLPLRKSILETAGIDHRGTQKGLRQPRVLLKDRLYSERETSILLSTQTNTMLEDTLESSKLLCFMRTASTSQTNRCVRVGVSVKHQNPQVSWMTDSILAHTNCLSSQLLQGLSLWRPRKFQVAPSELCCSELGQALLAWLPLMSLTSGFACSPSQKPSSILSICLGGKMALQSDVTLGFRQAGYHPPLAPHSLPTTPLVEAGCKCISNL